MNLIYHCEGVRHCLFDARNLATHAKSLLLDVRETSLRLPFLNSGAVITAVLEPRLTYAG